MMNNLSGGITSKGKLNGSLAIGKIGGISECKKNVYVGESPEEYTEVWFDPSEEGIIDEVATKKFVEERTVKLETSLEHMESIINSTVNINNYKRFETETDDTNRIKRAINDGINLLKNKKIGNHLIIEFNSGVYEITETINIPIFIKFKSIGNVIFKSKVANGSMFELYTPQDLNLGIFYNNNLERWSIYKGSWLNGLDGGFSFIRDNNKPKSGSIAITIGAYEKSEGSEYFTGWWNMNDIFIGGFDIGIKVNHFDTFLGKLDRLLFSNNNTSVKFEGGSVTNSGESITFTNCIFADGDRAIDTTNWSELEIAFVCCSFDFVGQGLCCNSEGFYRFTNCHFEGIGIKNNGDYLLGENSGIITSEGSYYSTPNVFISGCDIMSIRDVLFKSKNKNGLNVFIDSLTTKGSNDYNKLYVLCDDNVNVVVDNFYPSKYLHLVTQRSKNLKTNPNFENLTVGSAISDNMVVDGYKFSGGWSGKATISEKYFKSGKSIELKVPSGGTWLTIESEEIPCVSGNRIINNFYWFTNANFPNSGRVNIKTTFYDKNDKTLTYPTTNLDIGTTSATSTNNEWNRLKQMEQIIVPANAVKYKCTYTINPSNECTFYLTEFYSACY